MTMHMECASCHSPSRRQVLQGGGVMAAAGVGGFGGVSSGVRAQMSSASAAAGVPAIDIHAHYYPQSYFDMMNAEGGSFNAEFKTDGQTFSFKTPAGSNGGLPMKFIDTKQRLAEMDAEGVAVHALSLTTPMVYWADGETSHKLARAWNDGAIAAHKANPDRFVVLATLPMLDRDRAIDELNRVSQQPGVRGVYMGTNINGNDLDDPMFAPILARIEALDLPIFLHPLQTIGGKRVANYHLGNLIGNPLDTAIAASRLIFSGVLDRHPKLQVNLPHAGGAVPMLIGRMDHGYAVRRDVPNLPHPPSEYMRRFTYDTIGHAASVVKFLISEVGADRVMLGSDYCLDMGYLRPVQDLDALNLAARDKDLILRGTAARLLKL